MHNSMLFQKMKARFLMAGLFLFFISSSQPVGACSCARISSVKANMHTLQATLETFYLEHHYYPRSVQTLEEEAKRSTHPYWKDYYNPFTSTTGHWQAWVDFEYVPFDSYQNKENFVDILGIKILINQKKSIQSLSGLVVYAQISNQKYFIYGLDKVGKIIKDKGQVFHLSNS